jgi:phospholipid transport system substrate-binding protein
MRWRLIKAGGDWHIVDVEMHGVWLAIEQRAQIDSLLRKRGDISDIYADQTS